MHSYERARKLRALVVGVASATLLVSPAGAEDDAVQEELREMRELVLQLQDQVNSQKEEIDSQKVVIHQAGLDTERSSKSSLSSFLETTDFSGSVAASYFYNVSEPGSGRPGGGGAGTFVGGVGDNTWGGFANPWHPDHNSIQFDELWIAASRTPTEEMPVGFGFDIVYGALAEVNGAGGPGGGGIPGGGNAVWIGQAYLEYESPIGVSLTAGKFATHIGYEVPGAAYNYTVTRGFSYQSFQPVSQIGAKLSGDAGPVSLMVGVTNGLGENQVDFDGGKDLIWSIGLGGDVVSASFNGEFGTDSEFFGDMTSANALVLDWILELTPSDMIVAWVNLTFAQVIDSDVIDPWGVALNVGSHVSVTDRLGLTARFEYGRGEDEGMAGAATGASVFMPGGGTSTDAISLTGTIDYLLVDGLTAKLEMKWDKILDVSGGGSALIFPDIGGSSGLDNNQLLLGAQLVYAF